MALNADVEIDAVEDVGQESALPTPKLLPWLARKAGVDDAVAEALWQRVVDRIRAELGEETGQAGADARFWSLAMERLGAELAAAGRPRAPVVPFPLFACHNRLWGRGAYLMTDAMTLGMCRAVGMWSGAWPGVRALAS